MFNGRLTFEQVWRGAGTARPAGARAPGSGSLGGISCELASAEADCEKLQSSPETITDEEIELWEGETRTGGAHASGSDLLRRI